MSTQLQPPGELIDVNGRKVHVQREGTCTPLVLFESGLFSDSFAFYKVQPEIAKFTSTLSYDRAGMGYSEQSSNPTRNAAVFAGELYELLETLNLKEPMVFAGWSAGGIYIREFARQHPEMAAGMIFIDSAHENFRKRYQDPVLAEWLKNNPDETEDEFTKFSSMTHEEIVEEFKDDPFWDATPEHLHPYFKDLSRPELFAYYLTLVPFFIEDTSQGENALKPLGDVPLAVISRRTTESPKYSEEEQKISTKIWNDQQAELAALSTDSKEIKVDCGHDICDEEPEVVIGAVREVVEKVRASSRSALERRM